MFSKCIELMISVHVSVIILSLFHFCEEFIIQIQNLYNIILSDKISKLYL
jgi:hypothetical protein